MGICQGLSEYKPDAQASSSILAYTRMRFGIVLVRNYLPLALDGGTISANAFRDDRKSSYLTNGTITVAANSKLTVGAGQAIKFAHPIITNSRAAVQLESHC